MATMYDINLNLSETQFNAVGKITAYWSVIEWLLTRIIGDILGVGQKESRVLAIEMHAIEKVKVARLLAELRIRDAALKLELAEVLDQIDIVRPKRNLFAHGVWTVDPNGKSHLMRWKGGADDRNRILGEPIPMEDADIVEIRDTITNLALSLAVWWRRHSPELRPSQDKRE